MIQKKYEKPQVDIVEFEMNESVMNDGADTSDLGNEGVEDW